MCAQCTLFVNSSKSQLFKLNLRETSKIMTRNAHEMRFHNACSQRPLGWMLACMPSTTAHASKNVLHNPFCNSSIDTLYSGKKGPDQTQSHNHTITRSHTMQSVSQLVKSVRLWG